MLRFKLSERIADKEFRERRRLTVIEISEATGINRMTLSKLMNKHGANVQTDNLDLLCSYFGCRIEELVEHVPDAPAPSP
jgi:DNA-binding Xre family transcriptional regulator